MLLCVQATIQMLLAELPQPPLLLTLILALRVRLPPPAVPGGGGCPAGQGLKPQQPSLCAPAGELVGAGAAAGGRLAGSPQYGGCAQAGAE